jgi:pimeloyl-ACP methyl ester carboxylesterase
MTLDEWHAAGRRFDFAGLEIFYRDEGEGDTVLCIHGFPTASWDWHALWPELSKRYRVVAPDMLGFGFSAKPTGHRYSIADQADVHEALLAHLGIERCHVLAHDYGDTVAQELLARFLDRDAAGARGLRLLDVCFLNGGLFPETHRARPVQKLLALPVIGALLARRLDRERFGEGFREVFGPRTKPTPRELDDFWTLVSRDHGQRNAHRLIRYMSERRRFRDRWVGALVRSTIALRVVDGPADPVSGRHMADRYHEVVPDADVVLLGADIGHYPQIEDPAGTLAAYLDFLERPRDPTRG